MIPAQMSGEHRPIPKKELKALLKVSSIIFISKKQIQTFFR
jgi:hypothetical protein